MRSHRNRCVFFHATLVMVTLLTALPARAQLSRTAPLNTNVWQAVPPSKAATSSGVRQAYFQGPDGPRLPPIDAMPSPAMGAMPSLSGPPSLTATPLPDVVSANGYEQNQNGANAYNEFSNAGGYLPPTHVQPAGASGPEGSGLRDAQVTHAGQALPPFQNSAGAQQQQPANGGLYRPMANQQQPSMPMSGAVYPPNPQAYQQTVNGQLVNGQPVLPPAQFRDAIQRQSAALQSPVVSGDPRFISPAPRMGNYATSPYRAPFRNVSYQVGAQQPVVPQAVLPPTGLANQPQVVPNTSGLPQYQPTVGQNVTYQNASYQALQPGVQYCQPGLPVGGVPSVVPGAVVPPTLPPNLAPQLYASNNSGYRPLFSLGQENYNVQLGRGIIGQPTVYVPGQYVRNFLRYLAP